MRCVCLRGTQRHGGIGSTPLLWHSSLLREKVVGSANSNSANSRKMLCFCGFMTQIRTQLRKAGNGYNTSKQGRRVNAIGANTAQYGYKAPVVHSMRTFGSRMPQVRILSLGPPYEKNRQKWRFFFVYCSVFWWATTAACPRFSPEKQKVIHSRLGGQIVRFPNRSLIGGKGPF